MYHEDRHGSYWTRSTDVFGKVQHVSHFLYITSRFTTHFQIPLNVHQGVVVEYARTSVLVHLCPFTLSLPSLADVTAHSLTPPPSKYLLRALSLSPSFYTESITRQFICRLSMKLKSISLAATGLWALVGANPTVKNEGEVAASSPRLIGLNARASQDACYDRCHVPWMNCMNLCGQEKDECSYVCNCSLFRDSKSFCRRNSKSTPSRPGLK